MSNLKKLSGLSIPKEEDGLGGPSSRVLDTFMARLTAVNSPSRQSSVHHRHSSYAFPRAGASPSVAARESVDLATLALVNPGTTANVQVADRIGLPDATQVVVTLLFIGFCAACETTLDMMKTWFNRVNINQPRNQLEVILISASKKMERFVSIVQSATNPFYAVPFGSEQHRKLLSDFGVSSTDEDPSFEPRLVFLEWLGARSQPAPATECRAIRNPIGFVDDLHLEPLIHPINHAEPELRRLLNRPDGEQSPPRGYDSSFLASIVQYPPIDRVKSARELCSYYYNEIRDNLYDLRGFTQFNQQKYIRSLGDVVSRICHEPGDRSYFEDAKQLESYNIAIEVIRQGVGGVHILDLIGAGKARLGSTGRLMNEETARIDCKYFQAFYQGWVSRIPYGGPIPVIKTEADPRRKIYLIRIYYRTSSWSAIRDDFPPTINDLRRLVEMKAMNVEMGTARLFSSTLNPMMPQEIFSHGITAARGSLSYGSLEEIQEQLAAAPIENGMRKIRIVVMGPRKRLPGDPVRYYSKPIRDKEPLLEQTSKVYSEISALEMETMWLHEVFKIYSVIVKLAELDELQEEMLSRIPVQDLHIQAANNVIRKRTALQRETSDSRAGGGAGLFGASGLSTSPQSLSSFPPPGLTSRSLTERAKWDRISYEEELLRVVTAWFADEFFSWLPTCIACQHPDNPCPRSNMYLVRTRMGERQADDFGQAIEHPILKPYVIEDFVCSTCRYPYNWFRPLQDLRRIIDFPQGRCAEHAKAFHLTLRALGFDARIAVGRFRPWESFRRDDPRSRKWGQESDHSWNEVYLESRREWIPIDPSASDSGTPEAGYLGVLKSKRFDNTNMFAESEYRPFFVATISKENAQIVSEKYLQDAADVEYAKSIWDKTRTATEVASVDRIMAENDNLDEHDDIRHQRTKHVAQLERSQLDFKLRENRILPRIGRGDFAPGPSSMEIRILGGEIPHCTSRTGSSLFHTYDTLMRFDHSPFYVCRVDVTKKAELVVYVAFGYCLVHTPDDVVDIASNLGMPNLEPLGGDTVSTRIPITDWIISIHVEFNEQGLLSEFVPELASQAPVPDERGPLPRDNFSRPIVGFYGSRIDKDSLGIDFIGFYQLFGGRKRSNSGSSSS